MLYKPERTVLERGFQAGGLTGQVVVEVDLRLNFCQGVVSDIDAACVASPERRRRSHAIRGWRSSRYRGRAGRRYGIAAPAGRPPGDCRHGRWHWQRPDRSGLVNHDQNPPVSGKLVEHTSHFDFSVDQRRVVQMLALTVQGNDVLPLPTSEPRNTW